MQAIAKVMITAIKSKRFIIAHLFGDLRLQRNDYAPSGRRARRL